MTGFFEEVGNFRMCSTPRLGDSPLAFSSLVSLRRRGAGSVRVDANQIGAGIRPREPGRAFPSRRSRANCLSGLTRESCRAVLVPLTRRDFPSGSLVEIFEVEAAAPRRLTSEDDSVPSYAIVETFEEAIEFALDALRLPRDRFCPSWRPRKQSPQTFPPSS